MVKKKAKKKEKVEEKPYVTSWRVELEWSNGKKEWWEDLDDSMNSQDIDDGITEYEQKVKWVKGKKIDIEDEDEDEDEG